MSLLEQLKNKDDLNGTLTIKINTDAKKELLAFCKKHKISMGKLTRKGIEMVMKELANEIQV
jgi:hypothetical protein